MSTTVAACPVRNRVVRCPRCKAQKTCGEFAASRAELHSHLTVCRDCFRGHLVDQCECGHEKWKRNAKCKLCYEAARPGRYVDGTSGYVFVLAPDHPASRDGGYVREHRLVMERRLGRFLMPNENVHHLNGVRSDNRDENLELWTVTQPSGQRVSDLVSWAEELLRHYAPGRLA